MTSRNANPNETAMDAKKKEKGASTSDDASDWTQFIRSFSYSVLFTICIQIFVIGSLGVYTSKVALSNILPDDLSKMPYAGIERVVVGQPIDINIMRPSLTSVWGETLSQPILFDAQGYTDSFQDSFLCSMKRNAKPEGWFANPILYLAQVYEAMVANNFAFVNRVFPSLAYMPDSLAMIVYGFCGLLLWFILYLYNLGFSFFYHLVNIPHLFRRAATDTTDTSLDETKSWESADQISLFRLTKWIAFCCLWFPLGLASAFWSPLFFTLYGLISPLYAKYWKTEETDNKGNKTMYSVVSFLSDAFRYKTYMLLLLSTMSLLYNGSKTLDTPYVVGILLAILIAYMLNVYSNPMPSVGQDGFTYAKQAEVKVAKLDQRNAKQKMQVCPLPDDAIEDGLESDTEANELIQQQQQQYQELQQIEKNKKRIIQLQQEKTKTKQQMKNWTKHEEAEEDQSAPQEELNAAPAPTPTPTEKLRSTLEQGKHQLGPN